MSAHIFNTYNNSSYDTTYNKLKDLASSDEHYSLVFNKDRKSIWSQGVEYGYSSLNNITNTSSGSGAFISNINLSSNTSGVTLSYTYSAETTLSVSGTGTGYVAAISVSGHQITNTYGAFSPSISANGDKIKITVASCTSSEFTVPYATTAGTWKTARNIYIKDSDETHTGAATSVDGSANAYLKLPSTIDAAIVGNVTGNLTGNVTGNLTGNVTGNVTGNADTADKWKTSRNIYIKDADGTNTSAGVGVDGSANAYLKLPSTIKASITGNVTGNVTGNLTGNVTGNLTGDVTGNVSGNAGSADKWKTARDFYIKDSDGTHTGDASSINGTSNAYLKLPSTIDATIVGNVTGNLTGNADTADKWKTSRNIYIKDSDGTNTSAGVGVDGSANAYLKLPSTIKASITGNVTGNLTGNVTGNLTGNVTGNADTADKWKTSRNIYIKDSDGTNTSAGVGVDGSANAYLKLPSIIKASITGNVTGDVTGNVSGNAGGNAATATKFSSARTITLTGDITGSASSDGTNGWSIATQHYSPTSDATAALSVDASGGSNATFGTTQLVTGVNISRDAKGHVTGLTVDSIKLPSLTSTYPTIENKNTNQLYNLLFTDQTSGSLANSYISYNTSNNISNLTFNPSNGILNVRNNNNVGMVILGDGNIDVDTDSEEVILPHVFISDGLPHYEDGSFIQDDEDTLILYGSEGINIKTDETITLSSNLVTLSSNLVYKPLAEKLYPQGVIAGTYYRNNNFIISKTGIYTSTNLVTAGGTNYYGNLFEVSYTGALKFKRLSQAGNPNLLTSYAVGHGTESNYIDQITVASSPGSDTHTLYVVI